MDGHCWVDAEAALGAPARPQRAVGLGHSGGPHPQPPPALQEPLAAHSAQSGCQRSR